MSLVWNSKVVLVLNLVLVVKSKAPYCNVFEILAAILEKDLLQEFKKYPRKTCGCGQPREHLIRILKGA